MDNLKIDKFPLCWPVVYKRTRRPERSRFGTTTSFGKARDEMFKQVEMLVNYPDKKSIVLSTNIALRLDGIPYAGMKQPEDKGVALYFKYKEKQVVLCCDKWDKVEHNIWSIAKTVEAMRGIDRWGVSDFLEHSFTGFTALPARSPQPQKRKWWEVMAYPQKPGNNSWDWAGVQQQYKSIVHNGTNIYEGFAIN